MNNYFSTLSPSRYPILHSFLQDYYGDYRTGNVEQALLAIEQLRHSPPEMHFGLPDQSLWSCCVVDHELGAYTIERLCRLPAHTDSFPAITLRVLKNSATILTTNYDIIADSMLSQRPGAIHGDDCPTCPHCKMRALLRKSCECTAPQEMQRRDWQGALLKLHGSIAWKRCAADSCCYYRCVDADQLCRPFKQCSCDYCGSQCSPVLVMPSASKDLAEYPGLAAIWKAACLASRDAEHLFVYGFSLPTTDCLLGLWLKLAFNKSRKLKSITVLDLNPGSVVERFQQLVPSGMKVSITGFKAPPLGWKFQSFARKSNHQDGSRGERTLKT